MSDAHRRLLDLLAGWSQYVYQCAESEEPLPGVTREQYEREAEVLHGLYQSVGARAAMTTAEVEAWVRTNITTFLRLGAA